ncbi:Development/cell death domain [Sesbania bispinosa]|nr:Development/cell death domain [Sesbania bispinosa]
MGFNNKHNNADGRDPDFGAIFMSNSETKRECFKRRLFGLPSSKIHFVEQVKAGMILFLFEYEQRQLHGVFKASCDGAMNIVPNAFTSLRKQFPAQVKFIPIWHCKPLPENTFRGAIKENYFSSNKFNFGLSENQVNKLLNLFSMRKLELEVPRKSLARTEDLKSVWYRVGRVGGSDGRRMHIENEQGVGDGISPVLMHKYRRDPLHYKGEDEYIGLNGSDVVNKQGRAAELEMDTANGYFSNYFSLKDERGFTAHDNEDYIDIRASEFAVDTRSGHVSDCLALKDKSRFTALENKDYMDICLRPNIIGGYSQSPSDKIRGHGDGRLSLNDSVNPSVFYSKPILEHNSLVQNHHRQSSAMVHPIQAQIINDSPATQGHVSSILYNPDAPGLNFCRSSSVGINDASKSILEGASLSTNSGRISLNGQQRLLHAELKDMNRWHDSGRGFVNSVLYGSNRDCCMAFNEARNSEQLASESVLYEPCNTIPIPPSDVENSGVVHESETFSLFQNRKSFSGSNVHPIELRENLSHEITLPKNKETFSPNVPWANKGHSQVQYGDPLNHEPDIGCYGDSQNNNSGHPRKKSVFSRLSFMQDVNNQEDGNNAWDEESDFHTSVDEVMEMVRQTHNQWIAKRKPKPSKHNKAESLRDKTQIISSRTKDDCSENTLKDLSMDLTTTSGGNSNKTAEERCFVDFKRRSKVRKLSDGIEIRTSIESEKGENAVLVQQKRRKLIRPNFSKSTTSDDKGIDPGASQNLQVPLSHGSYNLEDVSERCSVLVQTEDNIKTDAEVQNIIGQTHCEDKNSGHVRGYVCSEGGEKATEGALTAFHDGSECMEKEDNADKIICAGRGINTEEEIPKDHCSSFSIKVKDGPENLQNSGNEKAPPEASCQIKGGLRVIDGINSLSPGTEPRHSICQKHHLDKIRCAGRGIDTGEMSKDGGSSFTGEVKDGFDGMQNPNNEDAPVTTSYHIKKGLCMTDIIKSVSSDSESLHPICHEHHVDNVKCTGGWINTEEGISKDGSSSFITEVKDGSGSLQYSGNSNAPTATCEQERA